MRRLGEDEHGVWLGSEAGGTMRKGDGPVVPIGHAHVGLIPHDSWWTAWFNAEPERIDVYCDITTPPEWRTSGEVTMVDLDLDICRLRRGGDVVLLDEDEFAAHQVKYGYPPKVIDGARAAAAVLYAAVADRSEPFADAYRSWLALVE